MRPSEDRRIRKDIINELSARCNARRDHHSDGHSYSDGAYFSSGSFGSTYTVVLWVKMTMPGFAPLGFFT